MNTRTLLVIVVVIVIVAAVAWWLWPGVTGTDRGAGGSNSEFTTDLANVEELDVLVMESFPVQVAVVAKGNHPDGCTNIADTSVERLPAASAAQAGTNTTFNMEITTKRPRNALCTQALVPFEERADLPVRGLPKGSYAVNVNGVKETFELRTDNSFEDTSSK